MNPGRRTTRPRSTGGALVIPTVESTGASIFAGALSPSVLGGEVSNSQRDQNRATIIINLGGSDSDTSRATPAVNRTSTSGSVRDLPYSSISSALDQEQSSILEESSVSTDSGLGSGDAPLEIESTPTEEDNSVEEEPSSAIYERHMYLKKHGFPLWIPQPNMRLSRSYRRQGVNIGDVGIFTSDGGFDFLFNICLPAGHPSNPDELPEGFSRLHLKPADVSEFRAHSSHSHMASPSIQKQGVTFECSDPDGAILIMPQGAYHEDLRNISKFRDYAFIHAESWYRYANGPCGREIGNAELHLVTGCDKTTSWGIATYSHIQSKRFEDKVSLLSFNTAANELQGRDPLYPTYSWDYVGMAEAKVGPEDDELLDLPEAHAVAPLRNQCTFVRSLTPAFGDEDWKRLQLKVAAPAEARESVKPSPFTSVLGAISSLPGRIGSLRGRSRVGTSRLADSMIPTQAMVAHPATYVVKMLLQECPMAKVVVVHDSDWCSVIRESDDWMSVTENLQHRIQEAFDIVEEENGSVYLQEKKGSSQQPNTSSSLPAIIVTDTDAVDYHPHHTSSPAAFTTETGNTTPYLGEKRSLSPADFPSPKRFRSYLDRQEWETGSSSSHSPTAVNDEPFSDADVDQANVQSLSISTTSEGGYRRHSRHASSSSSQSATPVNDESFNDADVDKSKVQPFSIPTTSEEAYKSNSRRDSLSVTHLESPVRRTSYPPTDLLQVYAHSKQSSLSSYTFPPDKVDATGKSSGRPRLSIDLNDGTVNSYESNTYPLPGSPNHAPSTTISSSLSGYHQPSPPFPYSETQSWDASSRSNITSPSLTLAQLSVKYDKSSRPSSFSASTSQAQPYGSARISGQHGPSSEGEWSFPSADFVPPSGNLQYSPSMAPPVPSIAVSTSQSRSPQAEASSSPVDRPQVRKRRRPSKEVSTSPPRSPQAERASSLIDRPQPRRRGRPSKAASTPPSRSLQAEPSSPLVDRPQRKRGKPAKKRRTV